MAILSPTLSSAAGLRSDPDTTCSKAYSKDATKEGCLATKDHFQRPCEFCTSRGDDDAKYCYNSDEARWAKIFGESCETIQTPVEADASAVFK